MRLDWLRAKMSRAGKCISLLGNPLLAIRENTLTANRQGGFVALPT
jgi:hypothetical protein